MVYINPAYESGFIKVIVNKHKGLAPERKRYKRFDRMSKLIAHLTKTIRPDKKIPMVFRGHCKLAYEIKQRLSMITIIGFKVSLAEQSMLLRKNMQLTGRAR